jgi:hypothetical protein
MAELLYHIEHPDPRTEAVFAFLFESLGIVAAAEEPPGLWDGPHLVYGVGPAEVRAHGLAIPERADDLIWDDLLAGRLEPSSLGGRLPFDLIGAIGRFLRDEVPHDSGPAAVDRHGRLRYAASAPATAGLGDRPIVNEYVAFLGRLIRDRLGVVGRPRWPNGRVAAIGLSHDVDLPDRYAFLANSIRPWRLRRSPRTYLSSTFRLAAERSRDPDPHDHWLFDPIMTSEMNLGFRSTFFFATVPFHDRLGAPEDVHYDLAEPRFLRAFGSIRESGFEIGLHASYRAYQDPTRLTAERSRLATLAGTQIAGVRHHYWQLGPDPAATLRAHEQAGFAYDSSIAFNDHVGFRRSVALPFQPFDDRLGRPLETIQLPTFCMDGNLFYESDDIEAAVTTVDGLVARIAATGGMGSIDWHIQTSHPVNRTFRSWGTAYQEILGLLAARGDLWVTSLGAIADWVAAGPARLASAA